MRLSKSSVLAYIECPLKFKRQYINGLPYENIYMEKGKNIHEIANKFFDVAKPDDNFIEVLKSIAGKQFEEYELELTNFAKMEGERKGSPHFKPLFRETKIIIDRWNVSGIIDRIDYDDESGELVIWDYKTGTVTPKTFDDMRFELSLYAFLVYLRTRRMIYNVGVRALKTGKIFRRVLTDKDIENAILVVLGVQLALEDEIFDAKEGNHCYWCPYKQICKKQKEEAKQAKLNEIGMELQEYQ